MTQKMTAMDGFSISVGETCYFNGEGSEGWAQVRGFRGDRVLLDPIDGGYRVYAHRWPLKPEVAERVGRSDFWAPRDHGVSLGCIYRPDSDWFRLPQPA